MTNRKAFRPVLGDARLEARVVLSRITAAAQVTGISSSAGVQVATPQATQLAIDLVHIGLVNYSDQASALVRNAQAQVSAGLLTPSAATSQLLSQYTSQVLPPLVYAAFQAGVQLPYGAGVSGFVAPGNPAAPPPAPKYQLTPSGGTPLFQLLTVDANKNYGPIGKIGQQFIADLQKGDFAAAARDVSIRGILPAYRASKAIIHQSAGR